MNIVTFIQTINRSPEILSGISVCLFKLQEPSPLFVGELTRFLKSNKLLSVYVLDFEVASSDHIQAQLEMSFLGSQHLYILKNIQALDLQAKKKWLGFIKKYTGPHVILLFDSGLDLQPSDQCLVITIDAHVTLHDYQQLVSVLYSDQVVPEILAKLFGNQGTIALDRACILMAYQTMIGAAGDNFLQQIITNVTSVEKSFFTLSSLFFARQRKDFFNYLINFKDYPDEFWTVFWSDQLWQASLFVTKAQEFAVQEAKQLGLKLPFSFVNKDWRLYTPLFLAQAHQFLYSLDYRLKNGGGDYGLELWYHKFLLNKF